MKRLYATAGTLAMASPPSTSRRSKTKVFVSALCLTLASTLAFADSVTPQSAQTLQAADSRHFTGNAEFARLPLLPSNGDVTPAIVHFKPNAFTDWHTHSQGQYLIVTDGTGRYQEWGKPVQTIAKGDVVWVAPNVKHWHGAGEFTAMSHIAISPVKDNAVQWLEKAVPEQAQSAVQIQNVSDGILTAKQLAILPLALVASTGDQAAVKANAVKGLQAGLTWSELKEAVSHQFAYIGAPKTLNAMNSLKALYDERRNQGITDPEGKAATDVGKADFYTLGTQKMAILTKRPSENPIFAFAPALDYALKAQLFGYQFARDNLGDVERELATVGSLVSLGESVNAQLRSHLTVLKNLGLTEQSFKQITENVDGTQAANLRKVWAEVQK
ncbi:quercetin dioxygenase-like cupin family protein [Cricetibacter osteomyelitidis]|uniref:Quercetin dioxygenase-like cupin family protein n=1 Tax=Cricetibacter osteomyelitidis TaxID=1521931 RepID=A0A4R2T3I1_9PAST|nr:carboxymuconolactone decarboxylase family protein [Cricetibacter osteomyelitidis]TCP96011.1 quercetin dioxygenase-like cupin family protein [Cricetibacter osteomyelitidis]